VLLCAIATSGVVDCPVSADMQITCLKAQEIHVWPKVQVGQQSIQLAPVESTHPRQQEHTHKQCHLQFELLVVHNDGLTPTVTSNK